MLSEGQRQAVAAYHESMLASLSRSFDIDRDVPSKQLSLGMRIASFLGALALAASVFFLFHQFWGWFSELAQVSILIGASLGTLAATLWIQGRDATGYFTKLAAMVAFACFVLNVSMLGQIYNIAPSDKALVPWAALALLLAYTCDLRLLLTAGILCIIAFTAARTGTFSGLYWIHFGERPENFLPVSFILFMIPQWVAHRRREDFSPLYRVFGLMSLLLPVLILSNWGAGSYLAWETSSVEHFYQACGFLLSAGAIYLGVRRHWPDTVNTGVTFFVIFLYTKLFDWWWDSVPKYLFFLIVGLTAILFLLVLKRLRGMGYARGPQHP